MIQIIIRPFLIASMLTLAGCGDWAGVTKSANIEVFVEIAEANEVYTASSVWQLTGGVAPEFLSTHPPLCLLLWLMKPFLFLCQVIRLSL